MATWAMRSPPPGGLDDFGIGQVTFRGVSYDSFVGVATLKERTTVFKRRLKSKEEDEND